MREIQTITATFTVYISKSVYNQNGKEAQEARNNSISNQLALVNRWTSSSSTKSIEMDLTGWESLWTLWNPNSDLKKPKISLVWSKQRSASILRLQNSLLQQQNSTFLTRFDSHRSGFFQQPLLSSSNRPSVSCHIAKQSLPLHRIALYIGCCSLK